MEAAERCLAAAVWVFFRNLRKKKAMPESNEQLLHVLTALIYSKLRTFLKFSD
jgi:hypothetical protein